MNLPRQCQFANKLDYRVWTVATIAKAIRKRGAELGFVEGDCYATPPPSVCSLEFEHLVIRFAAGLHPLILRNEKLLVLRMVRAYLATAKQIDMEGGDNE